MNGSFIEFQGKKNLASLKAWAKEINLVVKHAICSAVFGPSLFRKNNVIGLKKPMTTFFSISKFKTEPIFDPFLWKKVYSWGFFSEISKLHKDLHSALHSRKCRLTLINRIQLQE